MKNLKLELINNTIKTNYLGFNIQFNQESSVWSFRYKYKDKGEMKEGITSNFSLNKLKNYIEEHLVCLFPI